MPHLCLARQRLQAITAASDLPALASLATMTNSTQANKLVFERIHSQKDALIDILLGSIGTFDTIEEYDDAIGELDVETFCATHITALAEQALADAELEMAASAAPEADETTDKDQRSSVEPTDASDVATTDPTPVATSTE